MPRKSWWARLPFGVRMAAGASALLVVGGGVVVGVAALSGDDAPAPRIVTAIGEAVGAVPPPGAQADGPAGAVEPPVAGADNKGGGLANGSVGDLAGPAGSDGSTAVGANAGSAVGGNIGGMAGSNAGMAAGGSAAGGAAAARAGLPPGGVVAVLPPGGVQQFGGVAKAPRISDQADRTATRVPHRPAGGNVVPIRPMPVRPDVPVTVPKAGPVVTTRTDIQTRDIPFQTRLVRDPSLPRGVKRVRAQGVPGEETLRYLITLTNGRLTDRKLMDSSISRQPQHRVVAVGSGRSDDDGGGTRDDDSWVGRHWGPVSRQRECWDEVDICLPFGREDRGRNDGEPAMFREFAGMFSDAGRGGTGRSGAGRGGAGRGGFGRGGLGGGDADFDWLTDGPW